MPGKHKLVKRNCQRCNQEFDAIFHLIKKGQQKFCSVRCGLIGHKRRLGVRHNKETIKKMRSKRINKICLLCGKNFGLSLKPFLAKNAKYCSHSCASKVIWTGRKHRKESKKKISQNSWMKGRTEELHPNWIVDRAKLKKRGVRNDCAYLEWRRVVIKRDKGVCKMKNEYCYGCNTVHHILPWRDFPNERYNINNGITLCQAHHPRKRAEEKLLAPTFQELISQMN